MKIESESDASLAASAPPCPSPLPPHRPHPSTLTSNSPSDPQSRSHHIVRSAKILVPPKALSPLLAVLDSRQPLALSIDMTNVDLFRASPSASKSPSSHSQSHSQSHCQSPRKSPRKSPANRSSEADETEQTLVSALLKQNLDGDMSVCVDATMPASLSASASASASGSGSGSASGSADMDNGSHANAIKGHDSNNENNNDVDSLLSSSSSLSNSSDSSGTESSSSMVSWIQWFISLPGHGTFLHVPEEFIEDDFNLTGLASLVAQYSFALDTVLDLESLAPLPAGVTTEDVERQAGVLYGLIHARFLVSKLGLAQMAERVEIGDYGPCPRAFCAGAFVCPVGRFDEPGKEGVKVYCPRCRDIYWPIDPKYHAVDGAFFGTTLPHFLFMTFPELVPPIISKPHRLKYGTTNFSRDNASTLRPTGFDAMSSAEEEESVESSADDEYGANTEGDVEEEEAEMNARNNHDNRGSRGSLSANPDTRASERAAHRALLKKYRIMDNYDLYVPRIFGFRISTLATNGPCMQWLRYRTELDLGMRKVGGAGLLLSPLMESSAASADAFSNTTTSELTATSNTASSSAMSQMMNVVRKRTTSVVSSLFPATSQSVSASSSRRNTPPSPMVSTGRHNNGHVVFTGLPRLHPQSHVAQRVVLGGVDPEDLPTSMDVDRRLSVGSGGAGAGAGTEA